MVGIRRQNIALVQPQRLILDAQIAGRLVEGDDRAFGLQDDFEHSGLNPAAFYRSQRADQRPRRTFHLSHQIEPPAAGPGQILLQQTRPKNRRLGRPMRSSRTAWCHAPGPLGFGLLDLQCPSPTWLAESGHPRQASVRYATGWVAAGKRVPATQPTEPQRFSTRRKPARPTRRASPRAAGNPYSSSRNAAGGPLLQPALLQESVSIGADDRICSSRAWTCLQPHHFFYPFL